MPSSSIEPRKCTRCSATEGLPHPFHQTVIELEHVQDKPNRTRLVCQLCAMQLESRKAKKVSPLGLLRKIFSK